MEPATPFGEVKSTIDILNHSFGALEQAFERKLSQLGPEEEKDSGQHLVRIHAPKAGGTPVGAADSIVSAPSAPSAPGPVASAFAASIPLEPVEDEVHTPKPVPERQTRSQFALQRPRGGHNRPTRTGSNIDPVFCPGCPTLSKFSVWICLLVFFALIAVAALIISVYTLVNYD